MRITFGLTTALLALFLQSYPCLPSQQITTSPDLSIAAIALHLPIVIETTFSKQFTTHQEQTFTSKCSEDGLKSGRQLKNKK